MTPEEIRQQQRSEAIRKAYLIANARKRLNEYRYCKERLAQSKEEKKYICIKMASCKAIIYSDMPSGSRKKKDLSDMMTKLEAINRKIELREQAVKCALSTVKSYINFVDNTFERELLIAQYVELKTWKEIAKEKKISEKTISKKTMQALLVIGSKIFGGNDE